MAFQANDPGDHRPVVREFKSRRPHHMEPISTAVPPRPRPEKNRATRSKYSETNLLGISVNSEFQSGLHRTSIGSLLNFFQLTIGYCIVYDIVYISLFRRWPLGQIDTITEVPDRNELDGVRVSIV